jgi:hypothetical protein
MSVIDEVLEANEIYPRTHELRRPTPRPARKLAIFTCMDTRLSIRTLGLKTGDAPSWLVCHQSLLGSREPTLSWDQFHALTTVSRKGKLATTMSV